MWELRELEWLSVAAWVVLVVWGQLDGRPLFVGLHPLAAAAAQE